MRLFVPHTKRPDTDRSRCPPAHGRTERSGKSVWQVKYEILIPSAARCWRTGYHSAAATASASTPSSPGRGIAADGSPVRWHTGDPETDPWEWRMRVLEERDDIAYAKLFFRTSGYIAWPLYPLFYAVRRRGESLEEAYRRGTVSGAAKRIYDVLAASGGVPLHDLKLLGRFSKGEKSAFDRALTDLQSRMFITVCGREQKRDKNGRAYGWSSTVFTTVEDFWAVRGRSLGKEDPERAYAVLLARLRTLRPDLEPSRSEKALRG